ncbi:hypothetical protein SKAU_G00014140 [Synaphobranchus kaupii]|uniref:Uncharacterized protein n=1 Tax=Synaphobranchus kaupii TaxID=118154 RepID=A0A9Q1JBI6_SYNKA|nr:hypothetical protein SKAU_G00014140 [Synaphobranchus kaupii]
MPAGRWLGTHARAETRVSSDEHRGGLSVASRAGRKGVTWPPKTGGALQTYLTKTLTEDQGMERDRYATVAGTATERDPGNGSRQDRFSMNRDSDKTSDQQELDKEHSPQWRLRHLENLNRERGWRIAPRTAPKNRTIGVAVFAQPFAPPKPSPGYLMSLWPKSGFLPQTHNRWWRVPALRAPGLRETKFGKRFVTARRAIGDVVEGWLSVMLSSDGAERRPAPFRNSSGQNMGVRSTKTPS